MSLIRLTKSTRGKDAIIDNNYHKYTFNSTGKNVNYWTCANRSCKARISTRKSTGNLVGQSIPLHDHGNQLLIKKAKEHEVAVLDNLANVPAATTKAVLQQISTNILASSSPGLLSSTSSAGAVKMALWRKKQKINPRPKIPESHLDIMEEQIPDKLTKTADGAEFLILESWTNEEETESCLLFLSDWGAQILKTHSTWLMDGTFKSAPKPYSQVYMIMAVSEIREGQGLPCGFALLPNKEQSTYEMILTALRNKVAPDDTKPTTIVTDFERSVINAIGLVFPETAHTGCQFHFRAAIWNQIKDKGLQSFFCQNAKFQEILYKMYALSYVPVEQVIRFYEEQILTCVEDNLDEEVGDEEWLEVSRELEVFGDYFTRTWIGNKSTTRSGNKSRRRPLFAIKSWNQWSTVSADGTATNNSLECFNRVWNSQVGPHPNVWKVIDAFIKTESESRRILLSNAIGQDLHQNTGRKERSMANHQRLKLLAEQFGVMPDKEYLQQVAHELQKSDN